MAFLKKSELTESASGEGMKIWSVSKNFPTLLHTVACPSKEDVQELWVWAHNEDDSDAIIYLIVTSDTGEVSKSCAELPRGINKAPSLIWPGITLKKGCIIEAYASISDKITVYGYANELNQTSTFSSLEGVGANAYGQATHPSIGGVNHEINFDAKGDSVAVGKDFSLALRPDGSPFGWGAGNIVVDLLVTGDNSPWKNNVDIYSATDDLIVSSDGVPPHPTPYKNINAPNPGNNPHKALEQDHYFSIPKIPRISGSGIGEHGIHIPRGNVGVAVDGIPFDIRTAELWSGMIKWEEVAGPGDLGLDSCGGHVQPNGKYHYHTAPQCLYTPTLTGHSPIVGYAFDGLPIYGPVGYLDEADWTSGVAVMTSSYRLKQGNRPYGSGVGPGGPYDGTYTNDYEFISGLGHLDKANARFAITPEAPTGSWHYHTSVTGAVIGASHGVPVYPFSVGPFFKGTPTECNFLGGCDRPIAFPPRGLNDLKKIQVGNNHVVGLTSSGRAVAWGDNTYGQCNIHPNLLNGVVDISAGANHSLGLQAGQIIAWGDNELGQVSSVPAQRGLGSIDLIASGLNYSAPPSVSIVGGGTTAGGASGEAVLAGRGILDVSLDAGGSGFTATPDIVFVGGGGSGASATATLTSDSNYPTFAYVSAITLTHAGSGYTSIPEVHFVDNSNACTGYGVCGIDASGSAFLEGARISGFIVTASGAGYYLDPEVVIVNAIGDTAGVGASAAATLGGARSGLAYPVTMNGLVLSDVKAFSAGSRHNIALHEESGTISMWGDESLGQMIPPSLNAAYEKFTSVSAGGDHTLATVHNTLENVNFVVGWGHDAYSQVDIPSYARLSNSSFGNRTLAIKAGLNHSLILNPDGTVYGFGNSSEGQTLTSSITNANSLIGGATSNHSFANINETFTKQTLSSSDDGCGITITDGSADGSTCGNKTHIHRAFDIPNGTEEIWLWAYNGSMENETRLDLYMEPKETSSVTGIEIIDAGLGYSTAQIPTVIISGGGGAGATALAEPGIDNLSDVTGYIGAVTMLTEGSGYQVPPAVLITGGYDDPTDAENVEAILRAFIETGNAISYTLPPKTSGLHLLLAGAKLEGAFNIRAAARDSLGVVPTGENAVEIYGYVVRQERGLVGETVYYDNAYQIGETFDCAPITQLTSSVAAGETTLPVGNSVGFSASQQLTIDPYQPNEENMTLGGFSSLVITSGLASSHEEGAFIVPAVYPDTIWKGEIPTGAAGETTDGPWYCTEDLVCTQNIDDGYAGGNADGLPTAYISEFECLQMGCFYGEEQPEGGFTTTTVSPGGGAGGDEGGGDDTTTTSTTTTTTTQAPDTTPPPYG